MATSDSDKFARMVQSGIAHGLDVVEAWRIARAQRPTPQARQLQAEHDRLTTQARRETNRYRRRDRRLQTQVTAGTAVAGVAGTIGAIDVIAEAATSQTAVYGPSWMWIGTAVVGAVVAITSKRARSSLPPEPRPAVPPPPPAPVPSSAIGASEAQRLNALRLQLAQVITTMQQLHPGAADELRRADAEAAPPLHGLVDRLAVLDRIRREMSGTQAEAAATVASVDVRDRLAAGCGTYERLLAASATMLAAPDIARSTDEVLGPALQAMTAYTHGLQRTAESLGWPDP
ncbi:MAG: hypothetical protein FJW80_00245 [Actinobacteria bacterium]|nr:hypothetical protein [Actinomycetota bacterium]